MAEHVDEAMRNADEAIAALKRTKPNNAAEARVRSAELMRLNQVLLEASRKVVSASAAKRIATNGNGAAKPVEVMATSLSEGVLSALAKGLVPFLRAEIRDAVTPLMERIAELERKKGITSLAVRIAELEQKPGLKYQGVWAPDKAYSVGDFVTDHGSLWHCWDGNVGVRPGTSETWQLAVQRGRDAKSKGSR